MRTSQNGWPASPNPADIGIQTFTANLASGPKSVKLTAAAGPAFVEMIEWWDANVEPVTELGGYYYREIRGKEGTGKLSNHASGTAIDINATKHPFKVKGTMPPGVIEPLREKAASLGLKWGGDWRSSVDEMHFEVALAPPIFAVVSASGLSNNLTSGLTGAADYVALEAIPISVGIATAAGTLGGAIAYKKSSNNKNRNALLAFVGVGSAAGLIALMVQTTAKQEGD